MRFRNFPLVLMVLALIVASTGCGSVGAIVYRKHIKDSPDDRPTQMAGPILMESDIIHHLPGEQISIKEVTQNTPSSANQAQPTTNQTQKSVGQASATGQNPSKRVEVHAERTRKLGPKKPPIDQFGLVSVIGVQYNYKEVTVDLEVAPFDVCQDSEFQVERPADNDPCWKPAGMIKRLSLPPEGGRSSWIRVVTDGGNVPFCTLEPNGYGYMNKRCYTVPIDRWAEDGWCPGNVIVDWSWEIGHENVKERLCKSLNARR